MKRLILALALMVVASTAMAAERVYLGVATMEQQTDSTDDNPTAVWFYHFKDSTIAYDSTVARALSTHTADSMVWQVKLLVSTAFPNVPTYIPAGWWEAEWPSGAVTRHPNMTSFSLVVPFVDTVLDVADAAIAQQAEVVNLNGWNPATDAHLAIGGTISGAEIALTQSEFTPDYSTLTTTDNIGVNLNDVTGTLSGAEIALTPSEFTPSYSTFNASTDSTFPDLSHLGNRPLIGDTIQRNASTFAPATDKVTLVDTSAGDISLVANAQQDSIDAIISRLFTMMVFGGAPAPGVDSTMTLYFPLDASSNKDSAVFYTYPGPTRRGKWVFKHEYGDSTVADTTYTKP